MLDEKMKVQIITHVRRSDLLFGKGRAEPISPSLLKISSRNDMGNNILICYD
jgi:hypothetical protein